MTVSGKRFGFEALLLSLMVLLFLPGLIPSGLGSQATTLLLLTTLLAAIYVTAITPQQVVVAAILLLAVLASSWDIGLLPEQLRLVSNCLLYIGFLGYVCWCIGRFLQRTRIMSANLIYAAICIYLVLGLGWAFVYVLILAFDPGAIRLATVIEWDPGATRDIFAEMFYFSFVTMTTLGYGDVLPVSRIARSAATLQAVVGQLYLAIVIASLVGIQINQREPGDTPS